MKKLFKFILFFAAVFTFSNYVHALTSDEALTVLSDYCYKGTEGKGCTEDNFDFELRHDLFKGIKLVSDPTKIYKTVDINGRIVTAACYKVELGPNSDNIEYDKDKYDYAVVSDFYENGIYYYIKIFPAKDDSKCGDPFSFVYPSKGLSITYNGETKIASGDLSVPFESKLKVGNWRATANGSCPKYFGSVLDSGQWKKDGTGFYLSDNASDTFTSKDGNITSFTCIEHDQEERDKLRQCYKEFVNEASNYTCPADFSSFKDLASKAVETSSKCGFGKELSYDGINRNKNYFKSDIIDAISARYTECVFDKCGIDISKAKAFLGSINLNIICYPKSNLWCNRAKLSFTTEQKACLEDIDSNILDEIEETINNATKEQALKAIDESKELFEVNFPDLNLYTGYMNCRQILGDTLTAVVRGVFTLLQIAAAIIALVKGMAILIPAIVNKDADALKKASKQLVTLGILLVVVILLRPLIRLIGNIFGFDITCLFDKK